MRIAFLYGPEAFGVHRKPFDFDNLERHESGLTGTDLVALGYARGLAQLGHTVHFFCHGYRGGPDEPEEFEGVRLYPFELWEEDEKEVGGVPDYDVAIAVSNPNALRHASPKTLRVVNRQVS